MTAEAPNYVEVKDLLFRALQALAGRCNYASTQDGVGFNGRDANWGHQMASSRPDYWSPKATFYVYRMIRKYHAQLLGQGIDISSIPEMGSIEDAFAFKAKMAPESPENPKYLNGAPQSDRPAFQRPSQKNLISKIGPSAYRVGFGYNPEIVQEVKALVDIKNREYQDDATGKYWIVKADNAEDLKRLVAFSKKWKFDLADGLGEFFQEALEAEKKRQEAEMAAVIASSATDADVEVPNLNGELMPFQRAGVAYALNAKRTFIADAPGLGKTISALSTCEIENAFPVLVVCRESLRKGWERQINQFFPFRQIAPSIGRPGDYLIVSHHEIVKNQEILKDPEFTKFKALIVDECQDQKSGQSQRGKATIAVSEGQAPEITLLLSGTPLLNRPDELKSQLRILRRLDEFGGSKTFSRIYCGSSAYANSEALNRRLRATCFVRRLKSDVLKDLPEKRRDEIEIDLDNWPEYREAEIRVQERLQQLAEMAQSRTLEAESLVSGMGLEQLIEWVRVLAPRTTLKQVAEWEGYGDVRPVQEHVIGIFARKEANVENAAAIMMLNDLKRTAARGKLAGFVEWAKEFMEEMGQKLVVFAHHQEIQQALVRELPNAIWTRDTSKFKTSQDAVDAFASNPGIHALVASIKGDNAGLNGMQLACSTVAFLEFDWVFANHEQAEDRLHRLNQHDAVNAYYFKAPGSIDEKLLDILLEKKQLCEAIQDGRAAKETNKSTLQRVIEEYTK